MCDVLHDEGFATSHHDTFIFLGLQTLEDYEGTKQELAQLREQQEAGHREVASLEMKLEELEDEVQNFAAHRGTKLATIEVREELFALHVSRSGSLKHLKVRARTHF